MTNDYHQDIASANTNLSRRLEILANLQRQTGIPPIPETARLRWLRRIVLGLGIGGVICQLLLVIAAIIWFLLALSDWRHFIDDGRGTCFLNALVVFLFLTTYFLAGLSINHFSKACSQTKYPHKLTELCDALQKKGRIISGHIVDLERRGKTTQIGYIFKLPDKEEHIKGKYITTLYVSFSISDKVLVLYLDSEIYSILINV